MTAQLFYVPFSPLFTSRGLPAGAAKVFFYYTGTTTVAPIYADAELTTPLYSPVSADALGQLPAIYLDDAITYRVRSVDALGIQIGEDFDPYVPGTERAGPTGDTGPADNTYTSLTALLASDKGRKKANLVGDTDVPPAPDGPFNVVGGQWVRQKAEGIQYTPPATGASPSSVGSTLDTITLSPEQFGAIGNGTTDDTAAIKRAFNSGKSIDLTEGKTYLIKSRLLITANKVSIGGGGTLKFSPDWDFASDTSGPNTHFRAIFVEGEYVTFDGLIFDATGVPGGTGVENGFIWSTGPNTNVTDCLFIGNPKGTCIWGLSAWLNVQGCQARDCSALAFARGYHPIISNNIVINAVDAAIAINGPGCIGAAVNGNVIHSETGAELPSVIAVEEGATEWTITGNTLHGASGGGIWCGNVLGLTTARGGVIANNIVSVYNANPAIRPVVLNPATLIYVSTYYTGTVITGNKLIGAPSGNSSTRMALIPATGTLFQNNYLEGSGATGIDALVGILAGTGGITIKGNRSLCADGGRHVLFSPGDYALAPCVFEGGEFLGGAEAINSELQASLVFNFRLHIIDLAQVTATAVANAATAIGDRAAFLNAGGAQMPHRIGTRTEMYCNAVPAAAGALAFQNGDRFHANDPVGAGALTYVKVQDNPPFKKYGGPVA